MSEYNRTFQIGEIVAAYIVDMDDEKIQFRMRGKITEISEAGMMKLELDERTKEASGGWEFKDYWVHPKQCRRLKKRERRRWILQGHPSACPSNYIHRPILGPELDYDEQVEVVEVKK